MNGNTEKMRAARNRSVRTARPQRQTTTAEDYRDGHAVMGGAQQRAARDRALRGRGRARLRLVK